VVCKKLVVEKLGVNLGKVVISGLIGGVVFVLVGTVFGGLLLAGFPYFRGGVIGTIPVTRLGATMVWMAVIECLSFAAIFDLVHRCIPKKGIKKGFIYGFLVWYVHIFLCFLGNYAFGLLRLSDVLLVVILKLFMLCAYGTTLGWAHEKLGFKEARSRIRTKR